MRSSNTLGTVMGLVGLVSLAGAADRGSATVATHADLRSQVLELSGAADNVEQGLALLAAAFEVDEPVVAAGGNPWTCSVSIEDGNAVMAIYVQAASLGVLDCLPPIQESLAAVCFDGPRRDPRCAKATCMQEADALFCFQSEMAMKNYLFCKGVGLEPFPDPTAPGFMIDPSIHVDLACNQGAYVPGDVFRATGEQVGECECDLLQDALNAVIRRAQIVNGCFGPCANFTGGPVGW